MRPTAPPPLPFAVGGGDASFVPCVVLLRPSITSCILLGSIPLGDGAWGVTNIPPSVWDDPRPVIAVAVAFAAASI